MRRRDLTDAEWRRLEPLLPPRARTGRPPKEQRTIINALFWLARTGAPWRDLPERYGPWRTVATRFYRWTASGLWQRILNTLHQMADAAGQIDWSVHHVDSTIIRAHQHAAGAKGGQHRQALGRSRGGFSTKLHIRCDGHGRPMVFVLRGGERPDNTAVDDLLAGGRMKRSGPGRPRHRPEAIVGDRGYSSHATRRSLRRRGIRPIIPQKRNERPAYL